MPALWASGTNVFPDLRGSDTILFTRESMWPGDSRYSPNKLFKLQFQYDGNVVLLTNNLPDILVLWATATDDIGATEFRMQGDGNLLVLAGDTVLWASDTGPGNQGAYLSLQNDGNLVVYTEGAVSSIPVFSIQPDWADGVSESMLWLTAVSGSPTAVEQRLGLRRMPRQTWELSYTVHGPVRTLFDLLTMHGGGSPMYLPIWQDQEALRIKAEPGDLDISIDSAIYTHFTTSKWAILWKSSFEYEIVEVSVTAPRVIFLASPLVRDWPAGTLVYPVKKVRFETQPNTSRRADRAFVGRCRFIALDDLRPGIEPDAIYLDGIGSSVYALPGELSGIKDSPKFTMSLWVYRVGEGSGGNIGTSPQGYQMLMAADFAWLTRDPDSAEHWLPTGGWQGHSFHYNDDFNSLIYAGNYGEIGKWTNLLLSIDVSEDPPIVQMYANDIRYESSISSGPFTFPFSQMGFAIGTVGPPIGVWYEFGEDQGPFWDFTNRTNIADVWFAPGVFIDFTKVSNRRLFHDNDGRPVNMGDHGELPTGKPPAIFLTGNQYNITENHGSAGGPFHRIGGVVPSLAGLRVELNEPARGRGAVRWTGESGGAAQLFFNSDNNENEQHYFFSFWLRMQSPQAGEHVVIYGNESQFRFYISLHPTGYLSTTMAAQNFSGIVYRGVRFDQATLPIVANDAWHHIAISINLQTVFMKMYVDRVEASINIANLVGSGAFAAPFFRYIGLAAPYDPFRVGYVGDMAEFWFDLRDMPLPDYLNKFVDTNMHTADLGADGSKPTGELPQQYFTQTPVNYEGVTFLINRSNNQNGYAQTQFPNNRPVNVAPPPYP